MKESIKSQKSVEDRINERKLICNSFIIYLTDIKLYALDSDLNRYAKSFRKLLNLSYKFDACTDTFNNNDLDTIWYSTDTILFELYGIEQGLFKNDLYKFVHHIESLYEMIGDANKSLANYIARH